jgi:hypothetical protein
MRTHIHEYENDYLLVQSVFVKERKPSENGLKIKVLLISLAILDLFLFGILQSTL